MIRRNGDDGELGILHAVDYSAKVGGREVSLSLDCPTAEITNGERESGNVPPAPSLSPRSEIT